MKTQLNNLRNYKEQDEKEKDVDESLQNELDSLFGNSTNDADKDKDPTPQNTSSTQPEITINSSSQRHRRNISSLLFRSKDRETTHDQCELNSSMFSAISQPIQYMTGDSNMNSQSNVCNFIFVYLCDLFE